MKRKGKWNTSCTFIYINDDVESIRCVVMWSCNVWSCSCSLARPQFCGGWETLITITSSFTSILLYPVWIHNVEVCPTDADRRGRGLILLKSTTISFVFATFSCRCFSPHHFIKLPTTSLNSSSLLPSTCPRVAVSSENFCRWPESAWYLKSAVWLV